MRRFICGFGIGIMFLVIVPCAKAQGVWFLEHQIAQINAQISSLNQTINRISAEKQALRGQLPILDYQRNLEVDKIVQNYKATVRSGGRTYSQRRVLYNDTKAKVAQIRAMFNGKIMVMIAHMHQLTIQLDGMYAQKYRDEKLLWELTHQRLHHYPVTRPHHPEHIVPGIDQSKRMNHYTHLISPLHPGIE